MARTLNFRKIAFFIALPFFLLMMANTASAQNLIVNGDFESTNGYIEFTNYNRTYSPYVVEAGHYAIDNSTSGYGGGQGWPSLSNSNGKFMMVNGFGGNSNPSKVVWRQTVSVTTQTTYTFSYRVVNLNQVYYGQIYPAKLQVKINGADQYDVPYQLPTNNTWQDKSLTWSSGNNTTAVIEFYDLSTSNSGMGDDFCLDDISFVPDAVYSVTANNDTWPMACLWTPVEIPVLENDNISPGIQNASVQILVQPQHGEATVLSNKKIEYIFNDASFSGTDQMKYRVGFAPQNVYGEAWVFIQTGQAPQVANITAPGPICAGGVLGIPTPSVSPSGLTGQWEQSSSQTGSFQSFDPTNVPLSMNGKWVRYSVSNDCGEGHSNAVQMVVNVAPDITGTIQAPLAICAGDDLIVTPPTYDGNGTGAWEICQTQNGTYQSFNPQNVPITYNNWYLRYKVSNDCGNDVSNVVQIHVNDAPTIATPSTPQAICAGGSFNLTPPSIQNHGATITNQGWQIAATQNGTYNAFNNNNVPYTYNGYWIRYFAENDCGETHSASVQITVNDEPVVGPVTAPASICAGESFNLTVPQVTWRHTNQGTGSWEIAPTSTGEFTALNNNNIPFSYNGYYIRYKAVNGCGISYSTNVVQVTVFSTEPTYDTITACDTYVWNGVTCNQTGNYQAQVQNASGCTITAYLRFIMSDAYTETQTVSECNTYVWPKNGVAYNSSGTYEYTVESGDPLVCDSIFTLNLTINNAPLITNDISAPSNICAGSSLSVVAPQYVMNHVEGGDAHWEYATSANGPFTAFDPSAINLNYGTYYLRFAVVNACDEIFSNVVSFHVDDVPVANMQLSALRVCEGQGLELPEANVVWNNENVNDRIAQWQMSSTQNGTYAPIDPSMVMQMSHNGYWLRFVAHNSCGDDIVGPVQITVLSAENQWLETITACDAYEMASGEVITESQVVEFEEYEPCFHIVYQPVEIHHSDYVIEPITSCHEEYEWHGRTFYHSDQMQYAWDTLTNANLCDSIVELNLSFDEYSSFTHNRTACDSYEWEMKPGVTYTESVRDSVFVPAVGIDDCDTWYFLDLTLGHNTINDGGTMTECSGFVWHGVPYFEDAIIYDSLQTPVTHCDSIIAYQLNIVAPVATDTSIMSCRPIWWQEHYCEEEGAYEHVFQSVQGCDSIVTMHFSLADEIVNEVDTMACMSFEWYGHVFSGDEQWAHTFVTPQGCDSTVYLNVTFNETDVQSESLSACDSYEFHGVVYDQSGFYQIYHDTVYSQNGCIETIQLLNLTINDSDQLGVISGSSQVYVASNIVSGVYRYELDTTGVQGDIVWSLSNPDWRIVEENENYCRVLAGTPGSAILEAQFMTSSCGWVVRSFEINAVFYGVDDYGVVANVYPNPTKGTVTIEAEGIISVRLINMMGQTMDWVENDSSNHITLNLSGFSPSIYLLEIETVNGMVKRRVVMSRS